MNIKEVKELIREVLQSDISEFELEHSGTRVKIRRGSGTGPAVVSLAASPSTAAEEIALQPDVSGAALLPKENAEEPENGDLHLVTSPIVGTAYLAPSPGAEPYVRPGDQIEEGTILCLVEAMKLMNEIPSDIAGEVVRVYFENGRPVEFGQKLFGIRPRRQG
jgi:acetyl-CoA carboxylase biotin carboxyl carrier protein